jgi:N,N'-diacetyllegionaminate synthase
LRVSINDYFNNWQYHPETEHGNRTRRWDESYRILEGVGLNVEIVAEFAQGYEGSSELAHLLLKAAAKGGADSAKFQLVYADELATPDYSHYDLFRSLEMSDEVWESLAAYASELGMRLYVDIFGARSLLLAEKIGLTGVKVHGTDISNLGFLERIASSSISKVFLGAGGAFRSELERAVDILSTKEIVILLGFQGYPTLNEANQMDRIGLLRNRFNQTSANVRVGFADHALTEGSMSYAIAATALGAGAQVLEKHLTLSQVMELEDYEAALNPDQFAGFCETVRECAAALGAATDTENFDMSDAEQRYRKMIRRHVVSSRNLPAGTQLSPSDLELKRTSAMEVVMDLELAYGKTLQRGLDINMPLLPRDIK